MNNDCINKFLAKNKKSIYCNKCCCTNLQNAKIIYGPIGPQGIPGPTGPTGPSGENLVIRSTSTLDAGEQADVESYHDGNTTYLDFYIPKGYDGKPEKVVAGITTQVDYSQPAKVVDRYENGIHCFDFCIPQGKIGLQGIQGEHGPQGEKGEQGQKGDTGERGEIGPQGAKGDAGAIGPTGPTGPQGEKGETGPRGLPGEIGRAEGITIDETTTIGADEEAQVMDDFELNIHHLTFYIPQGKQGEKGEKGDTELVLAGTTTQVAADQPAKVDDRYEGEVHFLDFQIPQGKTGDRGPAGPQGIQGETGPTGSTKNINATIYNSITQDATNGTPLVMDEILTNNGMLINNSSITIPEDGTYIISFSINNGATATSGDCVGIYNNNTLVLGSRRPLTTSTNVSATVVVGLKRNDIITLVPTLTTARMITASGAPSAMLTVIQIA